MFKKRTQKKDPKKDHIRCTKKEDKWGKQEKRYILGRILAFYGTETSTTSIKCK